MAALRSAEIEDYYDEDFDEDYESECEYDRRDENDATDQYQKSQRTQSQYKQSRFKQA
ncbi:hypothetical protein F442_00485 [Phytophthora nicotianae P10297]|uniref:Uncharacterized protein n=1 Tax=Phytophthora nicotianae P10297 TaxID=1317064 RepID=W3A5M1_PHYNI|nr:hypothetical protein F442_00485 [Phytophthora nicotianae P10297]